ncbi:MAG: Crp/Fnr family transcriptional regulator [Alphaproteobacteria bacterium]|jgi:CRP/FNR family cyclic AMP-dependent transcriptional regulator
MLRELVVFVRGKMNSNWDTRRAEPTLAGCRLLEGLERTAVAQLEAQCMWRIVREGENVVTRDSDSRDVFFVVKGRCRIVNFSPSGREIAYAIAGPGDYFGEMAAIDGLPRSATVVALEDCTLASITPQIFRELIEQNPRISFVILEKLVRIVRTSDDRIMDLATLSAYQRVYAELLKLMKPDPVRPSSWLIYPLPTQAQIAATASTTRETVARVLSQLAQDGIAERKSKTLYIRQVDRLRQLCDKVPAVYVKTGG